MCKAEVCVVENVCCFIDILIIDFVCCEKYLS